MLKRKRDLISLSEISKEEIWRILELTTEAKNDRSLWLEMLKGKTLALLFQKPSNRTRVSFAVGIAQMGGQSIYLGPDEINLGVRESSADVSKTLSRYVDGIIARTHTHDDLVEMTRYATVPIINGLSDQFHPCQALTDLFSIKEKFGRLDSGLTLAYVGDGNNVCHSLLMGCAKIGVNINIATPPGYEPKKEIVELARKFAFTSNSRIRVLTLPQEAVKEADVIYSDVWVSMGQEAEADKRLLDFDQFQINAQLLSLAKNHYIFMHCLPAHRGQEVTEEIIDGSHSIVFDQAENRLHTQKAILNFIYNTW